MAVPVASDPGAEAELGQRRALQQSRVEPGCSPRRADPAVEAGHDVREDPGQIVRDVAELVGDLGPFQEDLARAPQSFQHRSKIGVDLGLLLRRPHLVLTRHEQQVELAVLLQHRGPLGLGGVGREHRLDRDCAELGRDRDGFVACLPEVRQDPPPRARDRGWAVVRFAAAAVLGGGVLFRERRQPECDRQRLGEPVRIVRFGGGVVAIAPWQRGRDLCISEVDQYVAKRVE